MVDMFDCCAVADEFSVFPPVFLVRVFFFLFRSTLWVVFTEILIR